MKLRHLMPVLLLGLAGCGDRGGAPAESTPAPVETAAPASNADVPDAAPRQPAPDPAPAGGIRVAVTLSPAAAERLTADAETVIVAATWFGEPRDTPEAMEAAQDAPWVVMARMEQELPGAGEAYFPDMPLDPAQVALIDTAPQFHINVYSGRRSSEDNLLSCGMFQDDLAKAVAGIAIDCKLIGEQTSP